jgi:Protein of unknown function (DUF3040)
MSLSAWEQQVLDSIRDGFAASDPQLTSLLSTFSQLASEEEMPVREPIRGDSRRAGRRSRRPQRHLGLQWGAMLLWLVVTVTMIVVAVTMNRGTSPGNCTGTWVTFCGSSTRPAEPKPITQGQSAIQIPTSTQSERHGSP